MSARCFFRSKAGLALLTALVGCRGIGLPGYGPPLLPEAPIVPEPMHCGMINDPVRTSDVREAIVGAADFHNHQFSNLGFGGRVVWGDSFSRQGIEHALSSCGAEGLCVDEKEAILCREVFCRVAADRDACRAACDRRSCQTPLPHGHFGVTDPVGAVLGQGYGHSVAGYPHFTGWPHYNTFTHQQVYHRWLRRAFDGGMKLMVMLAVSNETLCRFLGNERACDDMSNVDLQLKAARDLEKYIDEQNDCDIDGDGWYRIATSPAEARQIIANGGMAVVLGAEVDTLFGCRPTGGCDSDSVLAAIERYRALGVRHLFPIHVLDNGFGGAAAYADFFNFGNLAVNGDLLHVRDCAPDYSFRFGEASSEVNSFVSNIAAKLGITYKKYPSMGAHCNWRGLTTLGGTTIRALMKAKMIIDIDHMSAMMRNEVLDLAEKQNYAGLVSSHSGYTELYRGNKKSEGQLTSREVERLVALGGRMAPILHQGQRGDMLEFKDEKGNVRVLHDCGNSAKSFVQAYLYAAKAANGGGVGFGSDLNGLAGLPTPRFGPFACGADIGAEQQRKVIYPVATYPGLGPALPRSQVGNRVFDVNVDGYAHAGMFPDFVAELRAVGLTDHDLKPLFSSAEAYISMWECAEDPKGEACRRSSGRHPINAQTAGVNAVGAQSHDLHPIVTRRATP